MSKPEYQDIISEYSANKRTLQKLEHVTQDLEEANKKIKELEDR